MSAVEMHQVRTRRDRRAFLTFPWRIYRDDPLWVPPPLPERVKDIDPQRGSFFKHGDAEFYIARRNGHPVGTVCAAEDRALNAFVDQRECTFGFYECIDDHAVAERMLAFVRDWAADRGLDTVVGPFNLDRENSYGVLIEGRDRPPVLLCGHTPPYYRDQIERFGFVPLRGDNLAYAVGLEETPELRRLARLADRVRQRGRINIREPDMSDIDGEVDRIYELLLQALAHLPDFVPWRRDEVRALVEPFLSIADPELILFAEANGQTVGWFPGVPNLNEVLQRANGLRYPWDLIRGWWFSRQRPACLSIKSVLVLPEYWRTGVSVLLFDEMAKRARAKGYEWVDLSLTSEVNPYTPVIATRLGAVLYKRYRVYRLDVGG